MADEFDVLLTAYERGAISRRQLLTAFAVATVSAAQTTAQQPASGLGTRARVINHVSIQVSDVRRSAGFYQKLGLPSRLRPIVPPSGEAAYALDFSNGAFLSLIQTPLKERVGRIDHFCIGLDDFQARRDAEALRAAGIDVSVPASDAQSSFIIADPDGIRVQLSDAKQTFSCPNGIGNPPCDVTPAR